MSIGARIRAAQLEGRIAALQEIQGQQRGLSATLAAGRQRLHPRDKAERAGLKWGVWQAEETVKQLQAMIDQAETQRRMLADETAEAAPPPEALTHGAVEAVPTFEGKQIARVYRRLSPWAEWHRRGLISEEAAAAGDRFEREFQTAGLDALHALDLMAVDGTPGRTTGPLGGAAYRARDAINSAVATIGGHRSIPGDLVVSCVGFGHPVAAWLSAHTAQPGRPRVSPHAAQGMLLAALESLAYHYRRAGPERDTSQ